MDKGKKKKRKKESSKLTGNQLSFCIEYVKCKGNATEAYKNSSYKSESMKEATICNNAYKLLQNNDILTRIQELQEKVLETVNEEISFTLKDTVKGIIDIAEKGKTENTKIKAFDMLMKYFGGYEKDNEQGKLEVNIPITHWTKTGGEGTEEDFDKAFDNLD